MRLGQIGCGRQNPPVQSAELASSKIGMARACHQRAFRIGKRQPSIASLETQMVRRRWIHSRIDRLAQSSSLRPWMLVPESLVALAAEVCLTYIGVSKTDDHSRELTVPVQKTELVQTKVK
ncbi:Hypothetical_protein [Hexamita inflata]|uniref:Hypothetical_protein n=1 Tax=Hexamita inflata TaxID=28002 RepID=A0AA86TMY3_9EUKA|nr:Hypothetical protein HINF_LOCUS9886 [Hexamita inflata]